MTGLDDVTNLVKAGGKVADDLTESGEERQAQLTERLRIDMASDNWLSKSIRPLILLGLFVLEIIIVVAAAMGVEIDVAVTSQVGLLFGAAIGFYFDSKRRERIAGKNADANMKIKQIEAKEEARQKKHERKMERKERRQK